MSGVQRSGGNQTDIRRIDYNGLWKFQVYIIYRQYLHYVEYHKQHKIFFLFRRLPLLMGMPESTSIHVLGISYTHRVSL